MNRFWHGSVNAAKSDPDVGKNIQVRATKLLRGKLIVTDSDPDDQIYVLVVGQIPEYNVVGWIRGADAKNKDFIFAPNNRPPAYFVPQSELTEI